MTRSEFKKLTRKLLEPVVRLWGFTEYDQHYFKRLRGNIQDVFFLDFTGRDMANFQVYFGIHVPSLRAKNLFIGGIDQPTAEIGYFLGETSVPPRSNRSWGCADEKQINNYVPLMLEEFKASALPWYDRFPTLSDAAAEYSRRRSGERPVAWSSAKLRPQQSDPFGFSTSDPFGWATYGWMLEEIGKTDEARTWLQRAYDDVSQPLFVKNGKPVLAGTKGARGVSRLPEEQRLEELLRQSLKLPVPTEWS